MDPDSSEMREVNVRVSASHGLIRNLGLHRTSPNRVVPLYDYPVTQHKYGMVHVHDPNGQ